MDRVTIADLEQGRNSADGDKRDVAGPLGCEHVGMNYYELEPGQAFSGGMHTHFDQEEVFFVIKGTATFETPDGEREVGPYEVIRFSPGEYQTGVNRGDERVVALALGAPRPSTDVAVWGPCPACGATELPIVALPEEGGLLGECPECDSRTHVTPPSA